MITGTTDGRTTVKLKRTDMNTILTLFSPLSKDKELLMPDNPAEIDILIATDCISEGQNLQDTSQCDKKNIALLSKLIDQRMLFVLQSGETARLAVYRADKVLMSERKPISDWKLNLSGLDLEAVWENAIAATFGIDLTGGKDLDATIAENDRRQKLQKQITALEKKAMSERQPRRKCELAEEVKRLKKELEVLI